MPKKDATRSMSLTSQDSNRGVILADLVADVPVEPEHHQSSSHAQDKSPHNPLPRKENGINPAYEGNLDHGPAAVVIVDSSDTIQPNQARVQNGTDISKGVILNAYLEQGLKSGAGKPVELQMGSPQDEKLEKSEKSGPPESIRFQDMSAARKVAFGFSFLPSIMFVLCFAVILPCQKRAPCVEIMWTEMLNNTQITSPLIIPRDVVYSFHQEGKEAGADFEWGLSSFEVETGNPIWKHQLAFEPQLIDCATFTEVEQQSCLVMQEHAFHLFDASTGFRLMAANLSEHQTTSVPVVLPDCREGGLKAFVASVPPRQLKVVRKGSVVSTVEVPECDSPPIHLTPWTQTDTVDLVLVCRKGREDALIRMPKSTWCSTPEKGKERNEESVVLVTRKSGVLAKSLLLPTPFGLVVWTEDDVTLVDANGNKNWTVSTSPHIDSHRFLLYGKFLKTGIQIALFSSDKSKNFLTTILSFESGAMEWNTTFANTEASDVIMINGQNKDFVLLNTRKLKWDPTKQAVAQLTEVPTTILAILAEEEVVSSSGSGANTTGSSIMDDITFLEMGGTLHSIHEEKVVVEDPLPKTSVTVLPVNSEGLDILLVKTFHNNLASSEVRKMRIRNWDITLAESKQCELK